MDSRFHFACRRRAAIQAGQARNQLRPLRLLRWRSRAERSPASLSARRRAGRRAPRVPSLLSAAHSPPTAMRARLAFLAAPPRRRACQALRLVVLHCPVLVGGPARSTVGLRPRQVLTVGSDRQLGVDLDSRRQEEQEGIPPWAREYSDGFPLCPVGVPCD